MRKLLASCLLCLPFTAALADGPQKWTGFYIGAHGGYGWGQWDGNLRYDEGSGPIDIFNGNSGRTLPLDGWLGGGQIGFNYQAGSLVIGAEVDGAWANLTGDRTFNIDSAPPAGDVDYSWRIKTRLDSLGTARLRLGITNGPLLFYGTGGVAFGQTSSDLTVICHEPQCGSFAPLVTARGSATENHVGFAVGGGIEWAWTRNLSVKAEYVYVDLGQADNKLKGTAYPDGPSPPFPAPFPHTTDSFPADLTFHTVRLGLNYKFD